MSAFVKMMRSDVSDSLAAYPFANHMLNVIAIRARRTPDPIKELKTGEAIISASSLGLTDSQYRHAKKQLTKWGLCDFRATSQYTCGKLLNSMVYDINVKTNDEPKTSKRQTDTQTSDDKQRMKELRKKEDSKTKAKKASRLSPDWVLPEDYRQWVKDQNICHDNNFISRQAEEFKDYWLGVSGQKGTKLDWAATWRNHCRKEWIQWPNKKNSKLTERAADFDPTWGDKPEEEDLFNVVR